jgi:hypothetical protein
MSNGGGSEGESTSKELKCSPHSDDEKHSVDESKTCYSNNSLEKLKAAWNARHSDEPITTNDPNEVWAFLRQQMSRVCKNEACWLRKLLISEDKGRYRDLLNYTFAPRAPKTWIKKPTTWLTSVDIENVMKQYEHAYPSFMFLGPAPIDFDAKMETGEYVWKDIHDFNIENMIKRGKRQFGFIFNTDPHTKSGAHWISMFVDVRNAFIFFFDSTSDDIPSEIKALADRIIEAGHKLSPKLNLKLIVNKKDHQYKDTECGMYSIFMISNVLTGKMKPSDFAVKRISDEFMMKFRKTYFNSANLEDVPPGPSDTFD